MFIAAVASAIGGIVLARRGLRPLVELSSVAERIEARQMGERSGDDYRNTLGSCLEETLRLSHLVESLLFLAKLDLPQSELVTESLALSELLQTIKEFYEAAAEEVGIQLIVDSKAGLVIRADRSMFQRMIGNLIINALAHTPNGVWDRVFAESDSSMVSITVSDSGVGIQADQLPPVFDWLFRGSDCRLNNGHGLGLAIVKSTVELHGGKVTKSSLLGEGTAVRLHWPSRPRIAQSH